MKKKKRLDTLLLEKGLALSIEEARAWILTGKVFNAKGKKLDKAGMAFLETDVFLIKNLESPFVSRAGEKLSFGLKACGFSPKEKIFLDVGASTGGFTDCLLQNGAKHVFAVDVGYGLLHEKIRNHPQVSVIERTNARFLSRTELLTLSNLGKKIDALVMDVSFISIEKLVLPLSTAFSEIKDWLLLFKPQFEVEKEDVLDGGIVRNEEVILAKMDTFEKTMEKTGFHLLQGRIASPVAGKKSHNVEYFYHYEKKPKNP